jgi:hypothetical protein
LASITEDATRNGRYTGTVADKPAGAYDLQIKYSGYTVSEADLSVHLLLVAGTYVAARPAGLSEVQADTLDSIAIALAGMSPVEPTGTTVFQHLEQIQDSIDTYVSSALATVNGTQDTIVGFPDSLTVGDSYTEDSGNAIHVFIRDGNDDPISSVGSHGFTDSDFTPELVITNSGNAGRVRATVTYIDPGSSEPYLKVEIPLAESRRAAPGSATMQCVLKWNGCAKTLATQSVTWVARI